MMDKPTFLADVKGGSVKPEHEDVVRAIRDLVALAKTDTGGGRRARRFLMAWWNKDEFGGFDVLDVCNLDQRHADNVATCIAWLAAADGVYYPPTIWEGFDADMRFLTHMRRSDLDNGDETPGHLKHHAYSTPAPGR